MKKNRSSKLRNILLWIDAADRNYKAYYEITDEELTKLGGAGTHYDVTDEQTFNQIITERKESKPVHQPHITIYTV